MSQLGPNGPPCGKHPRRLDGIIATAVSQFRNITPRASSSLRVWYTACAGCDCKTQWRVHIQTSHCQETVISTNHDACCVIAPPFSSAPPRLLLTSFTTLLINLQHVGSARSRVLLGIGLEDHILVKRRWHYLDMFMMAALKTHLPAADIDCVGNCPPFHDTGPSMKSDMEGVAPGASLWGMVAMKICITLAK